MTIQIPKCKEQKYFENLISELIKVLAELEPHEIITVFETAQEIIRNKRR